jgi:hypothetical protein
MMLVRYALCSVPFTLTPETWTLLVNVITHITPLSEL